MQVRLLASYLCVVAAVQTVIYVLDWDSLFYFDPRIGLYIFSEPPPWGIKWFSVVSLGALALTMFKDKRAVRWYFWIEPVFASPTVAFFLMVIKANIGPNHGFSVGELLIPTFVLIVATLLPWCWALRLILTKEVDFWPPWG
jgi:hypothetical protein